MHQSIKKVSYDYEHLKYNTAIAQLITLMNAFYEKKSITVKEMKTFLILLNPISPHITEELWTLQGFEGYLNEQAWPEYDEEKAKADTINLPIQINGKMRGTVSVDASIDKDGALASAKADENIARYLADKNIVKEIFVPGKILNLIIK